MHISIPTAASASTDRRLAGWALAVGGLAWAIPLFVAAGTVRALTREDALYETLGAIAFLLASAVFAAVFTRTCRSHRTWWFLGLAVLFAFAAGEEISWGQRLLGWGDVDRSMNVQGESTVHNLGIFDTVEGGWLKAPRLFFLFWFGWLVALPLVAGLSDSARRSAAALRLPITPLLFGLVMLTNLALSKSYGFFGLNGPELERVAEIRECAQAVALLAVALSFWFRSSVLRRGDREHPQPISTRSRPTQDVPA